MTAARDVILTRVRAALEDVPAAERESDVTVERGYRHELDAEAGDTPALFRRRVADYRASVRYVPGAGVSRAVEQACSGRGIRSLVVPEGFPPAWLPGAVEAISDEDLSYERLDRIGAVVTACAVGIAETGTIVLDGGQGQGRRALSLIPDLHVCVVEAERIVGTVPEAMRRLEPAVRDHGPPLTFVSGPSATSDIELDRVEGVHGPRDLVVIVADG